MSHVGEIMREFAQAYRLDPSVDPREFLARVEGTDREELRLLIDGFLAQAPRQDWDPEAFRGSLAERAVAAARPPGPSWSKFLPELRERAELSRASVVNRLAAALGFSHAEPRVAAYYHRMEREELPASGVSSTVLESLGQILGVTAESLRRAGEAGEAGLGTGGEVFARLGAPNVNAHATAMPADFDAPDRPNEPDELDLLFTGGE